MGTRRDGDRADDELRQVAFSVGYLNTTPGSVLISMGETRVLCTAAIEERVPSFLVGSGKGWLTAEYSMLPGSSSQRVARESSTGRVNSRNREIQRLIGRSLRSIVDLGTIGERTIYVDCDVVQADGGTRTASVTGGYVALSEAVKFLMEDGVLTRNPLLEAAAAVSVGVVDGEVLLDLCYAEDARAETDMNVVMTASGGFVEIQGTAEDRPFTRRQADAMLDLAARGIEDLLRQQNAVLSSPDRSTDTEFA
jgi:ribonuclease PH